MDSAIISARTAIWFEATQEAHSQLLLYFNDHESRLSQAYCTFFLTAASCLFDYLDRAESETLIHSGLLDGVSATRDVVRELRNMHLHDLEYLEGEGHKKNSFHANTTFADSALSLKGTTNRPLIGGRLLVNDCMDQLRTLAEALVKAKFWPLKHIPKITPRVG